MEEIYYINDVAYCTGCGAALLKKTCHYCGTKNAVIFITQEVYQEVQKSPGFIYSTLHGSYFPETYFGNTVIVRN